MNTDFVVKNDSGFITAVNVKTSRAHTSTRTLQADDIEKNYWLQEGAKWMQIYSEDIDNLFAMNVIGIVQYYDEDNVFDDVSMVKHLLATKEVKFPLNRFINYGALAKSLRTCGTKEEFVDYMQNLKVVDHSGLLMNYDYCSAIYGKDEL